MKSVTWATVALLLPALGVAAPAKGSYTPSIQWGNCTENDPTGLDCGKIQVPLDWNEPDGEQVTLVLSRAKANNSENRIGSLFFNPGGPGVAATPLCQYQAAGIPVFTPALSEHFDIICPDPRGVGKSNPIICDPEIWNERVSTFPKDQASFKKLVDHNQRLAESCLNMTGPMFYHADTTNAAKDIEAIRIALDDGKISWLGISYGTQLGGAYAELFPDNIRAMAIDGLLDHSQPRTSVLFTEATTYEDSLTAFFDWCENNSTCAVQSDDVAQFFDDLVAQADERAIPAPGCVESKICQPNVTGEDILYNAQAFFAVREPNFFLGGGWTALALALNQTANDNATALSTVLASEEDPIAYPSLAIGCLDWAHANKTGDAGFAGLHQKNLMTSNFLTLHNKGATQNYGYQSHCIGWPAPLANPPHLLNKTAMARIKTPVLLVNAFHDPATSYVWAEGMLDQFPSGVLLTRNGYGHTSIFLRGEASDAIDAYLVNGTLPEPGTIVDS